MAVIIGGYDYLLRDLLVRWPDWRTRFDDSDPHREPQLKPVAHSEPDSKLRAQLSSVLGGLGYLHVHLRSFEEKWQRELQAEREAELRRQEERREQQKREQERQIRAAELAQYAERVRKDLEKDYLASSQAYVERYTTWMSADEFLELRKEFVRHWLQARGVSPLPDDEQLAAIATVEGNVRVVARAGSGKTTTLIRRFLFLQERCGVQPHEMLLLAFNRKAAENMREQFEKLSPGRVPHIMTFHALAYALVHPEQAILKDEPEEQGEKSKSRAVQALVDGFIQQPEILPRVRNVMLRFFRQDWEDIVKGGYDTEPAALLEWRRSIPRLGLDGQDYKSRGEKLIADFLFEHDVAYQYERRFDWQGVSYRPDFTLADSSGKQGLIFEYFGLLGDPDYDEEAEQKRKFWSQKDAWELIALTPDDFVGKTHSQCYQFLRQRLAEFGVECQQLTTDQLWEKLLHQRPLDRFTVVAVQFIQRCRKQAWSQKELKQLIAAMPASAAERAWLDLASDLYDAYLCWLDSSGEDDFDGLLLNAAQRISAGLTRFTRKGGSGDLRQLRFIAVDEYQDFSELFNRLLLAIRQQAPAALAFCVGDDWQAINGFAGSDLRFFQGFSDYFSQPLERYITTNYRSTTAIVELANQLMRGHGRPAQAFQQGVPAVYRVDVEGFSLTERERHQYNGSAFAAVVVRLVNRSLLNNRDVVLLSRTRYLNWPVATQDDDSRALDVFLHWLRAQFPPSEHKRITASTVHQYKGREKTTVIVLDALLGKYPLIHADSQFFRLFGDTLDSLTEAERRLFYVAITRPQQELYLLTRSRDESPFMNELFERVSPIEWSTCPPLAGRIQRIVVKVLDARRSGPSNTHQLKDHLKHAGYRWRPQERCWWRSFTAEAFTIDVWLEQSGWSRQADGIQVQFHDDQSKHLASYSLIAGKPARLFDQLAEALAAENQDDSFGGSVPV
ncbi:UvrD-helicase domain-containing protein [Pseudomonas aeruginosa]|uniref:UvrD-helicase domain-containing protein n=1 Tax=Pseudomonas aeruginosa TaxID=287 RepID=UPI0021AFB492|nr:UvrD-helicase domain-containing protein [Pseudomonas aeruginosa]MCT5252111.1 UvrD-helicase domain-containing protein [Pseudomonas aeruginosa]MDV8134134.1 UvrD-helicase domain-containing protein [Pseudomonas aeruginosa]